MWYSGKKTKKDKNTDNFAGQKEDDEEEKKMTKKNKKGEKE